jgi:3D (Asp-Asp-Asp) domain-containing protein
MKRSLTGFACLFAILLAGPAQAADPIGDLLKAIDRAATFAANAPNWLMKATLYHAGARGVGSRDSIGCKVVAMRTMAIDPQVVPKHSVVFIPETVGLPLPGGGVHDGFWYASDTGGAIKGKRIDLYTGSGAGSMRPLMKLNLKTLTVRRVAEFNGCPQAVTPEIYRVAVAG